MRFAVSTGKTITAIALLGAFLCDTRAAASPINLVTNGSFEDLVGAYRFIPAGSTILGWEALSPGAEQLTATLISAGSVQDGVAMIDLNADGALGGGGLTQTVATNVGTNYTLRFWAGTAFGCGDPQQNCGAPRNATGGFVATAGATSMNVALSNPDFSIAWNEYVLDFVASAANTSIRFQSFDPSGRTFVFLDNVSLEEEDAVPVPEPTSTFLMTVAISVVVARRWRRMRARLNGQHQ